MIASEVVAALRVKFPPNEYAFFEEVANGTGSHARRHLDVVVVGLWPSRGLDRWGFEVKVSKGDLKRELAEPEKADDVAKHLDYFSIAAPKGIAEVADLPSAWGLIEISASGAKWTKQPAKLEPKENSRTFFAALCRAAAKEAAQLRERSMSKDEYERRVRETLAVDVEKRLEGLVQIKVREATYEAERAKARAQTLQAGLDSFAKIVGVLPAALAIQSEWHWTDLARAVKVAQMLLSRSTDLERIESSLEAAMRRVREAKEAMALSDIEKAVTT